MHKNDERLAIILFVTILSLVMFLANLVPISICSRASMAFSQPPITSNSSSVDAVAVWQHGETGAQDIWYSIWDDTSSNWWAFSGTQASPVGELAGNDVDPAIAFDHEGNALAVWSHETGNAGLGYDIWYSKWSGSAWTALGEVASLIGDDSDPAVALDINGWAIAIWIHNDTRVYYSLWDGANWIGPAEAIVSDWPLIPFWGSSLPEIAFTSVKARGYTLNKAVAIWTQWIVYPEVPPLLLSRVYYAVWDGTKWSPSPAAEIPGQVYNAAEDGTSTFFRNGISSDQLGNVAAVWSTDTTTRPVYYALWNGRLWDDAAALDTQGAYGYMPSIAFKADNQAILTFSNGTNNIWHSRYEGGVWQHATEAADSGGADSRPAIAFLMSNRALAVWKGDAESFAPSEIFYSRWSPATGTWTMAASIVPQELSGHDANPSVASTSGSPTMPPIALSSEIHDVAIVDVGPSKTVAGQGYPVSINVTVENQGTASETFNITVYANADDVGRLENLALSSGSSAVFTFTWDTEGFAYGNYTTSAVVNLPSYMVDVDPADNSKPASRDVMITVPGDVNGDRIADVYDSLLLAKAYSAQLGSPQWNPETDINSDNKTDASDLTILSTNYGHNW